MKNNIVLLGVLVSLFLFAYFYQEKRGERKYVESTSHGRLLKEEITSLRLPKVVAEKREGQWWQGKQLLSANSFAQIERRLREIKEVKTIDGDWKTFAQQDISFEVNNEKWSLGGMSLDKQGFYVFKGGKISLAIIDGASSGVTSDGDEIEAQKLNELKSLLSRGPEDLKETQLFRFYPKLPLARVMVEAEGSLPFELNLKENTTSPPPIQGIAPHKDLKTKWLSLLTQVTIKQEVPYNPNLKFKRLGKIKFIAEDDKALEWELWLTKENSANAMVIDEGNKKAFFMIGGTLRVFFIQLQDYWDKKVIPASAFKSFDRLKVVMFQGEKQAEVTIINREPLDFQVQGRKVRPGNMHDLFQYVFNLEKNDQADRVSQLSKSERQQVLSEEHLRLDLMGQELLCWRKSQELILVNLTQGFKAHFLSVDENFRARFEDVLE